MGLMKTMEKQWWTFERDQKIRRDQKEKSKEKRKWTNNFKMEKKRPNPLKLQGSDPLCGCLPKQKPKTNRNGRVRWGGGPQKNKPTQKHKRWILPKTFFVECSSENKSSGTHSKTGISANQQKTKLDQKVGGHILETFCLFLSVLTDANRERGGAGLVFWQTSQSFTTLS